MKQLKNTRFVLIFVFLLNRKLTINRNFSLFVFFCFLEAKTCDSTYESSGQVGLLVKRRTSDLLFLHNFLNMKKFNISYNNNNDKLSIFLYFLAVHLSDCSFLLQLSDGREI